MAVDLEKLSTKEMLVLFTTGGQVEEGVGYDHLRMTPEEYSGLFAGTNDAGQEGSDG